MRHAPFCHPRSHARPFAPPRAMCLAGEIDAQVTSVVLAITTNAAAHPGRPLSKSHHPDLTADEGVLRHGSVRRETFARHARNSPARIARAGLIAPSGCSAGAESALRGKGASYDRLGVSWICTKEVSSQSLVWSVRAPWRQWAPLWNAFSLDEIGQRPEIEFIRGPKSGGLKQIRTSSRGRSQQTENETYGEWIRRQR